MTNINPNDDVGKINHIIKKESKVNKNKKTVAQTKGVEASSLDALNSYGKASISFRGIAPVEEVTTSQVFKKLGEVSLPVECRNLIVDFYNPVPAPFALSDLTTNSSHFSPFEVSEKTKLLYKILSEKELYNNKNVQDNIRNILERSFSSEELNVKMSLINKFLSEPKLVESESIQQKIGDIINSTCKEERLDYTLNLADKYSSNPDLYENEGLQKNIGGILYSATSLEKYKLADKFLSDPILYTNTAIQNEIENILNYSTYEAQYQISNKFLSEPNLFENESIQQNISNIILYSSDSVFADVLMDLIYKYLSDPQYYNNEELKKCVGKLISFVSSAETAKHTENLFDEISQKELSGEMAMISLQNYQEIDLRKLKQLKKVLPFDVFNKITKNKNDLVLASNLVGLCNKNNINEIPLVEKRDVVRNLVKYNKDLFEVSNVIKQNFPLIPTSTEEYCKILPTLVKSLGIETNEISVAQEKEFDKATQILSTSLADLSDEEFNNLSIAQEYSKDEFIQDTLSIVKDMPKEELQKVYDYFGFELHHNRKAPIEYSIAGYPVNLNNGKKLAQIEDENTKQIVEQLRPYVIKFSENNKIICDNKDVETALNEIVKTLPELRTTIGRKQYGAHEFDVLKHSLKVMQKTVQNSKFETLNDSDKKIMMLSALLHDITKAEIKPDPMHNFESSFDAFYISKKFNLTQDEQIKLYKLINHHEWLKHLNNDTISGAERKKRIQSVAFDLQNDNLFEMAKIFTESDIKAVAKDNHLYEILLPVLDKYSNLVSKRILELKKTQPLLPTTKLPKASDIKSKITTVNEDGSTNIKGIYLKDDLVIIKYNEVEAWETIGLPKGSVSRGIHTISPFDNKKIDTGNIKFIAHGLDFPNQISTFDALALPDSDALLSVSYMERPESKYRLFRPQGVLLDVDSKYVHGGGETDSGSGYSKNISDFKINYAYAGSFRHEDRKYIADLIKRTLNLSDEEYIEFVNQNKNKPMSEIQPKEAQELLIKEFALINSNTRRGNREYNEMYVSNPKVDGVFAYSSDDNVGEMSKFIDNQQNFLKDYAKQNDVPFVVFGD